MSLADDITSAGATSHTVLFLAVLVGSVFPVVPTGAVVSAASVFAFHSGSLSLLVVVLLAAVAGFAGDCLTFAGFRTGGRSPAGRIVRDHAQGSALDRARARLGQRGNTVLVVSRIVPAGRLPVLLAAALTRYPWRRFLVGDALAALSWAVLYATLGVVGGSIFPNVWAGLAAALIIVLTISLLSRFGTRWYEHHRERAA